VRWIKAIGLMRESPVGMIGLGLVLFWVVIALLAEVRVFGYVVVALAPFPPNANLAPLVGPFSDFILNAGDKFPLQSAWELDLVITAQDAAAAKESIQEVKAAKETIKAEHVCRAIEEGKYYCGTFWLGTDHLGRDILSRIIHGSRAVLMYAPLATFCAYLVGIPMGLAAGYRRGTTDDVLSFIANVILSFPVLVLYVIIIATVGASAVNIVVAVTFASAPGIFRIVRGLVLDLRNREYVFAAETRGETPWRIMLVEILPNARGPLIVDACLRIGYVIITIGVLGFLGLGLPPPDPDWGGMINETRAMAMAFPHMTVFPCIAISSLVLGFNLLADGLREVSLRD
jgi:peptide/nickel transport system permease protein